MSQFKITHAKGFQMTFDNGWTVSVQFGAGNYGSNRDDPLWSGVEAMMDGKDYSAATAEVAAWGPRPQDDDPIGAYQTTDDVAEFIAEVASRR